MSVHIKVLVGPASIARALTAANSDETEFPAAISSIIACRCSCLKELTEKLD